MGDEQRLRNSDDQEMPDRTSTRQAPIGTPDENDPLSEPGALEDYESSVDDIAARLLVSTGC